MSTHPACAAVAAAILVLLITPVQGQQPATPQSIEIPRDATLKGVPTIRIDSSEGATTRQILDPAEAARNPLEVRVRDGKIYWTSRENRLLQLTSSGPFTYLSSEPGRYIRLTRVNDRISYVEHVDMKEFGSVTWWGEMRIVLGQ